MLTPLLVFLLCAGLYSTNLLSFLPSFLFLFLRAALAAHGGSQAKGLIGAVATSLCHSHSNAGSELRLQPAPQLTDPEPTEQGQELNLRPHGC